MRNILLFLANILVFNILCYACDTTRVTDKSRWRIIYVDCEELIGEGANNGNAIHCIDNDPNTYWHTEWKNNSYEYPHEIQIDLGDTLAINGFSFQTRANNQNGRIKDFMFYVSTDSLNWGDPQLISSLNYPEPNSQAQQTAYAYFGTVRGRYVRLIGLTSVTNNKHVMMAEFDLYQNTTCEPERERNQVIYCTDIPRQYSTHSPITIRAHASSGLPLEYEILSGPATVSDSILTLTGQGGHVIVRISQSGDSIYYPVEKRLSFDVINLMDYYPEVNFRLTSTYPIEMPELMPYLLHTSTSIQEPDSLSISSVQYSFNGNQYVDAVFDNSDYAYWWTPSNFGNHTVFVKVTASNGNVSMDTVNVEVTNSYYDRTEQALTDAVINYDNKTSLSQWFYGSCELPQFVNTYNHIYANLDVKCPNVAGDCDDWDRLCYIQVKDPSGKWVEIIRYITPYGKRCSHTLDVTDFASLLQGKLEMRIFIDTWGTGGWSMDLSFQYIMGYPNHPYSSVEELWQGQYDFGNPLHLQPVDTLTISNFDETVAAHIRLITTGHGWGDNNTGNAAEFYHAVHHLQINGENTFEQDLWTDCFPNPDGCNNQNGTYKIDRAGWCPGSISDPYIYDITNYIPSAPFQLSYIFQPSYVDECHPTNPNCVSGETCPNCNDGYNPHYRVSCYLIRESNVPRVLGVDKQTSPETEDNIEFSIYPNPCQDFFRLTFDNPIENFICNILDVSGQALRTYFFKTVEEAENQLFNVSMLSAGTYFLQIHTQRGVNARTLIIQ